MLICIEDWEGENHFMENRSKRRMKTIGIDIGTTTISGVVLEKTDTGKPKVLVAKTIENGSFLTTADDWEKIQDAEKLVKKSRELLNDFLL